MKTLRRGSFSFTFFMKPKKSFIVLILALLLTPFTPSLRALSQKIDEKLDAEYAKATPIAIQPLVAEAAPTLVPAPTPAPAPAPATTTATITPITPTSTLLTTPQESKLASASIVTVTTQPSDSLERLIVPSINLDVAVGSVGLTSTGNMGVLDNPAEASWYKDGTVPGDRGSAVIGAHVFQSFAKLKDVKLGDSIYIEREDGSKLRFVVSETEVYPYADTAPLQKIFNRSDGARLNLITCDGKLTADHSTYDHRLVVFAELAG